MHFDKILLEHLIKELNDKSGFDLEKFVTTILTRIHGPTKWPPKDGIDGKIDFASKDALFQIYGSETPRGSAASVGRKISQVSEMKTTAIESGLEATDIIFLTNIRPTKDIAKQILKAKQQGIEFKDIYQTAEYLYPRYYPFDILSSYHTKKCDTFMTEDWPYDIDESTFVRNFDFIVEGLPSNEEKPEDCTSFIFVKIPHNPIFCVGNYGMGKTTISKILFKNWKYLESSIYPVYISLLHRTLSDFHSDGLFREITNEVKSIGIERSPDNPGDLLSETLDEGVLERNISRMIKNKKICLIFDGIDESICGGGELMRFLESVLRDNFIIFITSRREYRPFFDTYQALKIEKGPHIWLELCEWGEPQWDVYIAGLEDTYPEKRELISTFQKRLKSGTYSTLSIRPLFLKMLADLEINNDTDIAILTNLSSNLAEVYFKFIKWKIIDDYNRKGGVHDLDLEEFERECFDLLKQISSIEYKTGLQGGENQVTLNSIKDICSRSKYNLLTDEYIVKTLLKSSLFAILQRMDDTRFTFSHKSFSEYLVAYSLAECLLLNESDPKKSTCDETWDLFQTHEVSQHFVNEVERITVTNKLAVEKRNDFLLKAFKGVIDKGLADNLKEYDERFQHVLYYIGKFELNFPELVSMLEQIKTNKDQYHPIYFRTASLALSRLIGPKHCEDYVLHLLNDAKNNGDDFILNKEIQKQYYGETTLKKILKEDIGNYISEDNQSSIITLKILTYFTTIPTTDKEKRASKEYLKEVHDSATEQQDLNIQKICSEISNLL